MSGSRLTLARKLRGMSQTALAKEVGVTPRAISKYEKEGEGISDMTLAAIADALGFDASFFSLSDVDLPEPSAVSFRARSKMSAKNRDQALAVSTFGVELSDWISAEYILPKLDVPDLQGFDPEDAARAVREAWGLGEGPIPNVIAVLEAHGIRVFSFTEASEKIDAYSFWDEDRNQPFVFLTTSKSGERRRMDASHELGHLVMHRKVDLDRLGTRDVEKEADSFASAFLMPSRGFRSKTPRGLTLSDAMRVKRFWKVSAFAAVYRAHTLGLISDWQYHDLCKKMGMRGMRTNEPDGIEPERSQIADKVLDLEKESSGSLFEIANATNIPFQLIQSLTFRPPIGVIAGGSRGQTQKKTSIANFSVINTGRA